MRCGECARCDSFWRMRYLQAANGLRGIASTLMVAVAATNLRTLVANQRRAHRCRYGLALLVLTRDLVIALNQPP
jgi:hypothetical protein